MESTKGIEIKLGTYIDVNERKCRQQETYSYYMNFLSYKFYKLLFSLSCLGVQVVLGLQVLPFIDNSHLGSIFPFQ